MTSYRDREESLHDSIPVELYKFSRDSDTLSQSWFYANADHHVTFAGNVYSATPGLHRSNVQQNGESISMQIAVEMPRTACITDEVQGTTSPTPIILEIIRWQPDLAESESATLFNGEVIGVLFEGSLCHLTCASEESKWTDGLLRLTCSRACPHMLFDTFCGADPARVTFQYQITAIDDTREEITVESIDDPDDHLGADATFFATGALDSLGRKRFIVGQDANVLSLQTALPDDVALNDIMKLTAGCNRSTNDCANVHDNIDRFGGFPLMPDRSPWVSIS